MERHVIIVAGGKGLRMGADFPKQFISIGNKPILMRTIEAFYTYDKSIHIVVALSASYREHWSKLCESYGFSLNHEVVDGGSTRFESVRNALDYIDSGVVAIHDAVRPFASQELIENSFKAVIDYKAVVPVIDLVDSIRKVEHDGISHIVDRASFKAVQTPQVFDVSLLKKGYEQAFSEIFTDDASVVESLGHPIHLIEGEKINIKVTTPFDLLLADVILKQNDN